MYNSAGQNANCDRHTDKDNTYICIDMKYGSSTLLKNLITACSVQEHLTLFCKQSNVTWRRLVGPSWRRSKLRKTCQGSQRGLNQFWSLGQTFSGLSYLASFGFFSVRLSIHVRYTFWTYELYMIYYIIGAALWEHSIHPPDFTSDDDIKSNFTKYLCWS